MTYDESDTKKAVRAARRYFTHATMIGSVGSVMLLTDDEFYTEVCRFALTAERAANLEAQHIAAAKEKK